MKHLRYMGEFVSVAGIVWRVEILQEADADFEVIGSLDFPADEPLVIEWGSKSKEEVICSSVATLKIISPGDRTYEDLYSIEVGRVRLDVYRNNALYWSGCIDTEFYEEPYEMLNGYEVSLTFSDFGVLDRLKYDLADMQTLYALVNYCAGRCGINCGGIEDSLISTQLTASDSSALNLKSLQVRSDNFYDEDGEASTLAEVIKGILQPLALRMVQRCGKIYVYDLNGLYTKAGVKQIVWDGGSQTMGVDKVYNNAKITWSTYAQSGNLLPDKCWPESIETNASLKALNNIYGVNKDGAKYFSYHYENKDLTEWVDNTDSGFTIWTATEGNNAELSENVRFFKIVPQYDGTESEGIAIYWRAVQAVKTEGPGNQWKLTYAMKDYGEELLPATSANAIGPALFKTNKVWIPAVDAPDKLAVRIAVDMLLDPRFNPFETAENNGLMRYKDYYDLFNTYGNFVYVPVTVKFQPDGSDTVYVWTNRNIVKQSISSPVTTLKGTYGSWVTYTNDNSPNDWGYLCYYDAKDRVDTSGVLGWKQNRPAINPHKSQLISVLENAEAGQYIPYPNYGGRGGKLWVEVRGPGWYIVNEGKDLESSENGQKGLWVAKSWVLMKIPQIEIMNNTQFDQTISTDDVEYNAEINSAAKEAIEIDTICGTSAAGVPTARGAYFDASTGKQIKELTRAGRTTQVEDLLIGTLYSQFGQRRTTLSGEAQITHDPIATYKEDNQGDKKFILVEDVQDVIKDTSDTTFIELRPDEYTRND